MIKILVWGSGKRCDTVMQCITDDKCKLVGCIDNDPQKAGRIYRHVTVYSLDEMPDEFDYLIVAVLSYKSIIYQLKQAGFNMEKIVVFYDEAYLERKDCYDFIDWKAWEIAVLKEKVAALEKAMKTGFSNVGYEIIDKYKKEKYQYPYIADNEELIEKITKQHCSFIRFGDGEFEIMRGRERAPFQKAEKRLAQRLRQVIASTDPNILIGIADNYGELAYYTYETAQGIREYMTEETRAFHLSMLDLNRVYYNAYVFKTYMPYIDKDGTKERISLVKKVWENRDVVFVEGDCTRTGYGNDLFDNAKLIKRILCPTFNAYSKYDEILACGKMLSKDNLVLVALGPAGKVLAYDLTQAGYQVIDIGQMDMDYDWYLSGAGFRVPNPNKYVSQLPPAEVNEIKDNAYLDQIICKIE